MVSPPRQPSYSLENERSPEEVVDAIIRARGDHAAFLDAIGGVRREIWNDDWRVAERIIKAVQERSGQGLLNALERSALIGHFVEGAAEARAEVYPRFGEVGREMERIEREHAKGDEDFLRLSDAPQEFLDLDQEWQALVARATADWLDALNESDLARLAREQPAAFEHMIVAGQTMMGLGTDDVEGVLDVEIPPEAELTASLAVIVTMKRTKDAALMFRELVTGMWHLPDDDVHAVATVRFAHMLATTGHLDDNERFFVVDAIAEPIAYAMGMTDPLLVKILTRREAIDRTHRGAQEESAKIGRELEARLVHLMAEWLDGLDDDMARVLRSDRTEYQRCCAAGGTSLFGEYVAEACVVFEDP